MVFFDMNKFCCSFLLVLLVFIHGALTLGIAKENNPEDELTGLYISSKTRLNSANCVRNNLDGEEDKKREDIGIGEIVDLKLKGKLLPLVHKDAIKWNLSGKDPNCAILKVSEKDNSNAVLIAKSDVVKDGQVSVEVETNVEPSPIPKKFNILIPSGIKASNTGRRSPKGPRDGKVNEIGASAVLDARLEPGKVSFANISILEKSPDGVGYIPDWMGGHAPNLNPQEIGSRNDFSDTITLAPPLEYLENSIELVQDYTLPAFFFYPCDIYVFVEGRCCCLIGCATYIQNFFVTYDGERTDGLKNFKVKITKFGCSVERSTAGDAKHIDN